MNAPVPREVLDLQQTAPMLPTIFSMPEAQQIATLCDSLYPGAKPASALMVLNYCRAANLDPMQKPAHIVPMDVKTGIDGNGKDVYAKRDVVMPGIGLYRIQATRTGAYAGQDEPEFGPNQTLTYRRKETTWDGPPNNRQKREEWVNAELTFPLWCKVTVYRIVQGVRCAFTAKELWLENYGTAGRFSDAPNAMWEKRTFAQLAKCAEAQALRKGFPDAVSSAPTADELEGRRFDFDMDEAGETTPAQSHSRPPRKASAQTPEAAPPAPEPDVFNDESRQEQEPNPPAPPVHAPGTFTATGGERQNIIVKCTNRKRSIAALLDSALGEGHGIPETLDGLTKEQFKQLRAALA